MKSIHHFLISPLEGNKYNSSIKFSDGSTFIVSATTEDPKATQRIAKIISTPIGYTGKGRPGDLVVVHHHIFRKTYNMKGVLKESSFYVRPNLYMADIDLVYMYKHPSGEDWSAIEPYIFVSPIANTSPESQSPFEEHKGIIEYSSSDLYKKGQKIGFRKDSEYEFRFNDKVLYRMFLNNISTIES